MCADNICVSPMLRKRHCSLTSATPLRAPIAHQSFYAGKSDITLQSTRTDLTNDTPVQPLTSFKSNSDTKNVESEQCLGDGDSENLLSLNALSDSEKMLHYILENKSPDLQTVDGSSRASLESNIKFFKVAVQEIFDNFYCNIRDFESYKQRYYDILHKNSEGAIGEMEDFLKDMIQHITSNESMYSKCKKDGASSNTDDNIGNVPNNSCENIYDVIEASKDIEENIINDSDISVGECSVNRLSINDRNLQSAVCIKTPIDADLNKKKQAASAENFARIAEKRLENANHAADSDDSISADRTIPVKISYGPEVGGAADPAPPARAPAPPAAPAAPRARPPPDPRGLSIADRLDQRMKSRLLLYILEFILSSIFIGILVYILYW